MLKFFNQLKIKHRFLAIYLFFILVYFTYLMYRINLLNQRLVSLDKNNNEQVYQMRLLLKSQNAAYQASNAFILCMHPDISLDNLKLSAELNVLKQKHKLVGDIFSDIEHFYTNTQNDKTLYYETFKHNYSLISKNISDFEISLYAGNKEKSRDIFFNEFLINSETLTDALNRLVEMQERDISTTYDSDKSSLQYEKIMAMLFFLLYSFCFLLLGYILLYGITGRLKDIVQLLNRLSLGELPKEIVIDVDDEIGAIQIELNEVNKGLQNMASYAQQIERGNFDTVFVPLSEKDVLGNSLINMQKSLLKAQQEDEKRRQEEEKQKWVAQGVAMFSDILRELNQNIELFGYNVIKNITEYLKVSQGGMFIINEENPRDIHLQLIAAIAFSNQKFIEKRVEIGEGLVGTCVREKKTSYMSELPTNYIQITSGFGEIQPNYLLLVPLKLENKIFGVLELASFEPIEAYKIQFVERISENIASTLNNVKINVRTTHLLEESRKQSDYVRDREWLVRQQALEIEDLKEKITNYELGITD